MLVHAELDESKGGHAIAVAVDEFLGALTAVLEISGRADDLEADAGLLNESLAEMHGSLTVEQQHAFAQAWQLIRPIRSSPDASDESVEEEGSRDGEAENPSPLVRVNESSDDRPGSVEILDKDAAAVFHFMMRRGSRIVKGGSRAALVRRSLLVTAVSALEQLAGALIDNILISIPGILSDSDYVFTLRDLEDLGSIDDARSELRERKVRALLHDGVDGWKKFFSRRDIGIELDKLTDGWPLAQEFLARRNLLVHNKGIVDDRYIKIVGDVFERAPVVGDRAGVGPGYLEQGIQAIGGLGCALAYRVWVKLHVDEKAIAQRHFVDLQEELVELDFWGPAVDIRETISENSFVSRELLIESSIHRWTAAKFGNYDEGAMREEVTNWDTSGLDEIYSHARHLLLDEVEVVRDVVERLRIAGRISSAKVRVNPLYRDLDASDVERD